MTKRRQTHRGTARQTYSSWYNCKTRQDKLTHKQLTNVSQTTHKQLTNKQHTHRERAKHACHGEKFRGKGGGEPVRSRSPPGGVKSASCRFNRHTVLALSPFALVCFFRYVWGGGDPLQDLSSLWKTRGKTKSGPPLSFNVETYSWRQYALFVHGRWRGTWRSLWGTSLCARW